MFRQRLQALNQHSLLRDAKSLRLARMVTVKATSQAATGSAAMAKDVALIAVTNSSSEGVVLSKSRVRVAIASRIAKMISIPDIGPRNCRPIVKIRLSLQGMPQPDNWATTRRSPAGAALGYIRRRSEGTPWRGESNVSLILVCPYWAYLRGYREIGDALHITIFWTIVLGILGGGVTHVFSRPTNERYHPAGLIVSTLGAILILYICYKLRIHFPQI
jgi:uncharacterized membrane protein YeaQ/YmgE (transglycosylase-associated protein family)